MRYKEHDKCRICLFYLSNCNALRNLVIKISFRKCYCKDETMAFKKDLRQIARMERRRQKELSFADRRS